MCKSGFTNGRNAKGAGNDATWCVLQADHRCSRALSFDSADTLSYLTILTLFVYAANTFKRQHNGGERRMGGFV